jgi:alpha-galactosidase
MKKLLLLLIGVIISLGSVYAKKAEMPLTIDKTPRFIEIATENTAMLLTVDKRGELLFRYYGKRIADPTPILHKRLVRRSDFCTDPQAYTAQGGREQRRAALAVTHSDGDLNTELRYVSHDVKRENGVTTTTIVTADTKLPFDVRLVYKAYEAEDVIVCHSEITNREKGAVKLRNYYSANVSLIADRYYLTQFHGQWAREMFISEAQLTKGIKTISSFKHVRGVQLENPSFMVSLDAPLNENHGNVVAGALAWTGNFDLSFEVDDFEWLNILSGINPYSAEYSLSSGETFVTPEAIFTFSSEGSGQASRNLHDWARRDGVYSPTTLRPTLLNSWEGAYFKFNAEICKQMIDDAADMGLELFVLDDGWFGNKYPRNNARQGLGDWDVNHTKLPAGIDDIASYAVSKGLKFGIWIEPEMVNPKSELAEKHPEWVVGNNGREQTTTRRQWILDLSNPEVQEFVFGVFDRTMKLSKHISYIKWDANRHIENVGSAYLGNNEQSEFWVRYTQGLYKVYERIRKAYPNVVIQACASGGGRVEYGALKYHDEVWTSDNTDAYTRIFIQYGMSHIYPSLVMGSHVSAVPNHQNGSVTPLKFRFDMAMSGRLGMELQPKDLSAEEKAFARMVIANYKELRSTINYGDLYRLHSPYDGKGYSSFMYVDKDKSRAVVYTFRFNYSGRDSQCVIKLNGLDPQKRYRIREINLLGKSKPIFWGEGKELGGEYLINDGMNFKLNNVFTSSVHVVEEVK